MVNHVVMVHASRNERGDLRFRDIELDEGPEDPPGASVPPPPPSPA
jgi:hypothetical protein